MQVIDFQLAWYRLGYDEVNRKSPIIYLQENVEVVESFKIGDGWSVHLMVFVHVVVRPSNRP